MELTKSQLEAYEIINKRIKDRIKYTSLTGYAGTGKTYLIGQLVDKVATYNPNIYLTAPTHKAKQVLYEKSNKRFEAKTIHSFLKLRLVHDYKGGYKLTPDEFRDIPYDSIVFVDESSMLGLVEWEYIEKTEDVTWVFVGDPAQLPPVNQDFCPAIKQSDAHLNEIVRQQIDNPIIELSSRIRNQSSFDDLIDGDIIKVVNDRKEFLNESVEIFKSSDDISKARVLSYRNVVVDKYNSYIRRKLYGKDANRFVVGERLVAKDSWSDKGSAIKYITNSEEFTINRIVISPKRIRKEYWKRYLLDITTSDGKRRKIDVLHEEENNRYKLKLEEYKSVAIGGDKSYWKHFYNLKESFADVDYAYAMTVHKSQGSTFENVFVDYDDLMVCKRSERNALLYVAVTRPSEKLILFSKRDIL